MGTLLRLATAILIARLLGPFALGLFVLSLTLATGITLIATVGLDRTVLRFIAYHRGRDEPAEVFGVFVFASLVSAAIAMAVGTAMFVRASQLAGVLHRPELASTIRIMAAAAPLIALGLVSRAGLTGFQDVRLAAALDQVVVPVTMVIVFVAIHLRYPADTSAPVVAAAVGQGAVGLVSWLALWRRFGHDRAVPAFRPRQWLAFGFPLWLERGILFLMGSTGYFFLLRFRGAQAVGVYASGLRAVAVIGLPLAAVGTIFGPTISNLAAREEMGMLQDMYARLTRAMVFIGGALGLVIVAGGGLVLRSFGPGFSGGWAPLVILAAAQVVNSATGPSGLVLVMTGRTGWRLANAVGAAVLTVGLSWLLVPRLGPVGAALAVASAGSLFSVVQVYQVRRLVGLWAYGRPTPRAAIEDRAPVHPLEGV